jgi:hypothetical protein
MRAIGIVGISKTAPKLPVRTPFSKNLANDINSSATETWTKCLFGPGDGLEWNGTVPFPEPIRAFGWSDEWK